ncbi:hypothetical protein ACXR2T_09730 [Leucobacter sp. HY1910]
MSAANENEAHENEALERTVFVGGPVDPEQTVVRPAGDAAPLADPERTFVLSPDATRVVPDRRGDPVPEPELAPLPAPDPSQGLTAKQNDQQSDQRSGQQSGRGGMLRRAASFMPRVYAPRAVALAQAHELVADPEGGVAATNPRAALPSLARRDSRGRIVTLASYAAAFVVTGVGLWVVATLAFGA